MGTYSAVHVEDSVTFVDDDGFPTGEPAFQISGPEGELANISTSEREQLDSMVAQEAIVKPASSRIYRLLRREHPDLNTRS